MKNKPKSILAMILPLMMATSKRPSTGIRIREPLHILSIMNGISSWTIGAYPDVLNNYYAKYKGAVCEVKSAKPNKR